MFTSHVALALGAVALAVGLSVSNGSWAQARCGCPPCDALAAKEPPASAPDRRFSSAYGRFVKLADQGDAAAASAALFMLRNGKALFGSEWSATEAQQVRWNALAINAARHQATVVPNGADD